MLHRAAYVLTCGVAEIQVSHQVFGLLRVEANLTAVQIRDECAVAAFGVPVRDTFDLIVEPPPLLNDDDTRRLPAGSRLNVEA